MAMNYLEKKRQEEQQAQPAGLRGVSAQTQQQQQKYQGGYQPSQQTQQAQQNLQAVQQQKPQSYNSKYGAALDNILNEIQGGQDFKYSFDGDEMFKYYADLYAQNAKQGAANAMGNAAALTGGYGNSWASAQANQAYQQAILPLYDRGMDLRDRAYQQFRDKRGDLMDQAGLLQGLDATDYGRYRDTVGDYYADLDRAQAAADNERAFDYGAYMDQLGYWQNQAKLENADYQAMQDQTLRDAALEEQIRTTQADENFRQSQFDWQQATDARDYDEAVRRADLDEAYRQAQFGWQQATDERDFNEAVRQANLDQDYRDRTLAWQQETDLRDYNEAVRRADQDQDYRNAMMNWQQATDARDYEEAVRQANLDEAYRQKTFDESVRQADLDEAYRQQTFDEGVRQADLDEAYRRDSMAQNAEQFAATTAMDWAKLQQNQQQFEANMSEEERQYNQKMAASWVTGILANGQIPSSELLVAAGLSYEDAMKLVAILAPAGGGAGGSVKETTTGQSTIAKNTGNNMMETAKDIVFAGGNGIAAAMMNYQNFGNTGNVLMDIANGAVKKADGTDYSDAEKEEARNSAKDMYYLNEVEKTNDSVVDDYIRRLIGNGQMGTNEKAMKDYNEKLKKKKAMGV